MANYRTIARNTATLYLRMIFLMIVSLYTSRVVLQILGVEDYGIYNVVAGVVTLFAFLNTSLSGATQRFLSFSLGTRDESNTRRVFCTSVNLHILLGLLLSVLLETIGLWFFYTKLNIPPERHRAALWTFHISVLSTFISVARVPYSALIIAYERMDFFAYFSIAEVVFKLLPVFFIPLLGIDYLIAYSLIQLAVTALVALAYIVFCNKTFSPSKYSFIFEKSIFNNMLSYSGWSLFGGVSNIARSQGVNMLLNIYINVIVNAAVGIANAVSGAVSGFMNNFTTAFSPQIVKSYAENDIKGYHELISRSSKISFMLMSIVVIPMICRIDDVLYLWLGKYPDFAPSFTICTLLAVLVDSFAAPLWTAIGATGKMKDYQIAMFIICFLVLPYAWIVLWLGLSPVYCMMGNIGANALMLITRVAFLDKLTNFKPKRYLTSVVLIGCCCFAFSTAVSFLIPNICNSRLINLIFTTVISVLLSVIIYSLLLLTASERKYLKGFIYQVVRIKK